MESALLQLFAIDEILDRLASRRLTGCFHAFTPRESGAVFFQDGTIVSVVKGETEGEDVLKQIIDWTDARYVWQPEMSVTKTTKPLKINFAEFMARLRPGGTATGKVRSATAAMPAGSVAPHVIAIPSKGKSTGPLADVSGGITAAVPTGDHTATKTINATAEDKAAHDEALLRKFKLVLVSLDKPEQRYKLSRVNNVIGRSPACSIAIAQSSISRQHCMLQLTERGVHVKDLDTTNGTKVNGIELKEGYINVGDKLTIGHITFRMEKE